MYKANLFTKIADVNSDHFIILFWPDFRQDVTMYDKEVDYYVSEEKCIQKKEEDGYTWISIPENASWLLEVHHWVTSKSYKLHVTSKTREIVTPLGEEFNRTINGLLRQARVEYSKGKEKELRFYFYNSKKERLSLVEHANHGVYKYSLSRPFSYSSIDRQFDTPSQDCFILGRVKKTIGTKNDYLHDFIEPVHLIYFDFEMDEWDIFSLKNVVMSLLCFTIKKEYNSDYYKTLVEYVKKKESHVTFEMAVSLFINEINKAFETKDINQMKALYNVLTSY